MPAPPRCERFLRAMSEADRSGRHAELPRSLLNADWVRDESTMSLAAAARLRGYRAFLDAARDQKARRGSAPMFEREVLGQARRAQESLRVVGGATLRIARHAQATGLLDQAFTQVKQALQTSGPVAVKDLFHDVTQDQDTLTALAELGVTADTVHAMSEAIDAADVVALADDVGLRAKSVALDRDVRLTSRPLSPRSPAQLLFGPLFDAAADAWESPASIRIEAAAVRHPGAGEPTVRDPLDLVVAATAAARQELARHVRKLEDTRLTVYGGREPATAFTIAGILGIAASVALTAGTALLVICGADPSISPGSSICIAGDLLLAIGFILLAVSAVTAVIGVILQTAASASA